MTPNVTNQTLKCSCARYTIFLVDTGLNKANQVLIFARIYLRLGQPATCLVGSILKSKFSNMGLNRILYYLMWENNKGVVLLLLCPHYAGAWRGY